MSETNLAEMLSPAMQVGRTCAAIRHMAEGEAIELANGQMIMMGEDFSIGYAVRGITGNEWVVSPMATIDFKQLNDILNKEGMAFIIKRGIGR